jgi:hypothetical protein
MSEFRAVSRRRHLATSPFKPPPPPEPVEVFEVNDSVTHDKYGLGVVLGIAEDDAVLVDFGQRRMRIASPYTKMTKL